MSHLGAKTPSQLRDWLKGTEMWNMLHRKRVKILAIALWAVDQINVKVFPGMLLLALSFLSLRFDYRPMLELWVVITFITSPVDCRIMRWNDVGTRRERPLVVEAMYERPLPIPLGIWISVCLSAFFTFPLVMTCSLPFRDSIPSVLWGSCRICSPLAHELNGDDEANRHLPMWLLQGLTPHCPELELSPCSALRTPLQTSLHGFPAFYSCGGLIVGQLLGVSWSISQTLIPWHHSHILLSFTSSLFFWIKHKIRLEIRYYTR